MSDSPKWIPQYQFFSQFFFFLGGRGMKKCLTVHQSGYLSLIFFTTFFVCFFNEKMFELTNVLLTNSFRVKPNSSQCHFLPCCCFCMAQNLQSSKHFSVMAFDMRSHATTASPKPSFKAIWRVGGAVVSRQNARRTTSKSGHPCQCQNCSWWPLAEKAGSGSLLNCPSSPPNNPTGQETDLK